MGKRVQTNAASLLWWLNDGASSDGIILGFLILFLFVDAVLSRCGRPRLIRTFFHLLKDLDFEGSRVLFFVRG